MKQKLFYTEKEKFCYGKININDIDSNLCNILTKLSDALSGRNKRIFISGLKLVAKPLS